MAVCCSSTEVHLYSVLLIQTPEATSIHSWISFTQPRTAICSAAASTTSGMTTDTILDDMIGRSTFGNTYSPTNIKVYQSLPFLFIGKTGQYRRIAAVQRRFLQCMTAAEIMTQCCPSLTKAGTREAAQQVLMAVLGDRYCSPCPWSD